MAATAARAADAAHTNDVMRPAFTPRRRTAVRSSAEARTAMPNRDVRRNRANRSERARLATRISRRWAGRMMRPTTSVGLVTRGGTNLGLGENTATMKARTNSDTASVATASVSNELP